MENCAVLHLILEVHQNGILDELSLEETFLVDGAVEKALITEVPEEICCVVFSEEILRKVARKIRHLVLPQAHRQVLHVIVYHCSKFAVE